MHRHFCALLALCFAAFPSFAAITGVVMTGDGQPVSGARVSIRAIESSEAMRARLLSASPEAVPLASAQTDSKGTFSLESPKEPTVDLNISARGYEPLSRTIERDEEVGAVVVQKVETRKGSITAGGKPVANALVVVNYGGHEYLARTDEQGRYEAPDPKRAIRLTVVHPDFAVVNERFFSPTGNTSASTLNRTLAPGNTFKGKVVSGEQDTPVAKATIFVDGWPLATSGDDGTFTIAHMPLTWTSMVARKDTLLGQRAFAKELSATIRMARGATISGRVTDAKTRVPVAGTAISIGPRRFGPGPDTSVNIVTDAKGAYSAVVPAGTYMVMASHPGYDMRPADANAVAGQQTSKDLALTALARVSGVVVDESKRPVVVAAVDTEDAENARFGGGMRMMRGDARTVSGPDGRFSMRVQPDQEMWARATKRGYPPAKSDSFSVGSGERKSGMVLTIPSGVPVSGRVVDTHGDPLSGVAVTAAEAEGGQRMMFRTIIGGPSADDDAVRTASDGTFTLRVKEGMYDFTFRREDLAPKTVRGQSVTVASSPSVDAIMEPAAEISGRVTRAGTGLENVMVIAMVPGSGTNSAVTAPDGSFTLSGLPPGSVRIMARKPDDFVNEQRTLNAPARDVVIDIRPGGRVSGRVVEKGSGKPITAFEAGITTSRGGLGSGMVMMGPPQLKSFTSDDGSFTLDAVPAGAMVVMASSPGYASTRLNINVEEGKEVTGIELQLETGVKLTGRVTGPNGSALSDVQVRILPSPTGGFATSGMERSSSTDANGEYTIEGLEAGDESVSFSHPKHSAAQKQVTLKGRETRLDMQLTAGGRLSGVVVTESGAPVADAQVEASSGSSGFEAARTNANGVFEFDSVAPGRYRFRATKTGLADGTLDDVDVTAGTPVRIVMKTGGSIYGRITGLTAQELAQAQVEAYSGRTSAAGTVDPNGNYRIEGVAAGTVQLDAWAGVSFAGSSRRAPRQTIELASGGSQQVDIAFRGDIIVSGRVTRNGMPVAGGQVNFTPRGGSARGSGSSAIDSDGRYSVSGLEDGEYNVMVMDSQRGATPYQTTYQVRGTATHDIEYRTNALHGRVFDRGTNEPLANVSVTVRPTSTASDAPRMARGGVTDATGAFIIDAVPAGNYQATATKDGYGNESKELYVTDSSTPELEFQLAANPGLKLTVVDARDGRPITARAVAFDMQGRVADESRMVFGGGGDTSGVTLNVAPGTYNVTVSALGYAPRQMSIQSPMAQTIALSPGGTVEVRSKHNTPMRVRLIDSNGLPYPRSSAFPPSRELPPGTLTWTNIAAGRYTLQLLNGEAVVDSKPLVVVEGQTVTEEI